MASLELETMAAASASGEMVPGPTSATSLWSEPIGPARPCQHSSFDRGPPWDWYARTLCATRSSGRNPEEVTGVVATVHTLAYASPWRLGHCALEPACPKHSGYTMPNMSDSPHTAPLPPRIQTGIVGLDLILGGGLFKGGVYIVMGRPGTGKTILGNQLAFHH